MTGPSCTCSASVFIPRRMSVTPVANHRSGPLLRFLQHQAPSQRTGPTHPGCGVLRSGSPRFGSLKPEEDFTYRTVQFPGSISPIRWALSTARRRSCGRWHAHATPKPAKSLSQNTVSFSPTVSASAVRLVRRSSLRRGTVVPGRHSRCRRALEIWNQTANDRHQIGACWSAESTVMQGLLGGTIENYFNISSRLSNHGVLGTSAAYVEWNDILFSPIPDASMLFPLRKLHDLEIN